MGQAAQQTAGGRAWRRRGGDQASCWLTLRAKSGREIGGKREGERERGERRRSTRLRSAELPPTAERGGRAEGEMGRERFRPIES